MTLSRPLPLVTIIIPSFNQGRFIRETIDSCLAQDYRPIEILVMDGASTDSTVEVLKSFEVPELRWISEPDAGVVDAVNKGLALSKGAILTIQSSDDVFLPSAISAVVAALEQDPDAGLIYGDVELIDEHSTLIGVDVQPDFDFADYLGRFQYIPQPGACFTRRALESAVQWRSHVSYAADADFWMRIATKYKVVHLPKLVARYRYHEAQRDSQQLKIARDWIAATNDLIDSGALDPRLIRHVRMGQHLAQYRYTPSANWFVRTLALYRAIIANPPVLFDQRLPKRELIPGRTPIWSVLSRLKRLLGFAPK